MALFAFHRRRTPLVSPPPIPDDTLEREQARQETREGRLEAEELCRRAERAQAELQRDFYIHRIARSYTHRGTLG